MPQEERRLRDAVGSTARAAAIQARLMALEYIRLEDIHGEHGLSVSLDDRVEVSRAVPRWQGRHSHKGLAWSLQENSLWSDISRYAEQLRG